MKPESITKGFHDNYYVTVMNAEEPGDGELVEVSKNGLKIFARGFDEPKGIVFLNGICISLMLLEFGELIKRGRLAFLLIKPTFRKQFSI